MDAALRYLLLPDESLFLACFTGTLVALLTTLHAKRHPASKLNGLLECVRTFSR